MPARILVVEDDGLQQNLLRSALVRRGYEADVASDGMDALRKLRAGGYDLALIDYHLPEVDGLASARLLRELVADEDRPRLVAVTAALDALTEREAAGDVFDALVPKPLDLPALLSVVDAQLRGASAGQVSASAAAWRELGLAEPPAAVALPAPTAAQARVLRAYFDLSGRREPEAALLLGPEAAGPAAAARAEGGGFALPFVDLTGHFGDAADAAFAAADRASWAGVAAAVARFAERRRRLSPTALRAADPDTRLLAYLFLSGRPYRPAADPASRSCVSYPGLFPAEEAARAAERLAARGLLRREFADRFHACARCASSRLNVREECPSCRSPQLREAALVHHFRCAHQAPEGDFARGPHLVCPKCRQHLRHYGSDYDKPGHVLLCEGCGAGHGEPAVGFSCLDCGAHTDGEAAPTRDAFAYAPTEEGTALLTRGGSRLLPRDAPAGAAPLPPAILDALAARPAEPVAALAELRYGARERIVAKRGAPAFLAMRRLFLENLANALDGGCVLAPGAEADHLLVRRFPPGMGAAELGPALLDACQEVLAERLEPELRLLDPGPVDGAAAPR